MGSVNHDAAKESMEGRHLGISLMEAMQTVDSRRKIKYIHPQRAIQYNLSDRWNSAVLRTPLW